jgi:hypothetical protein
MKSLDQANVQVIELFSWNQSAALSLGLNPRSAEDLAST